jgi:hypothetical protein
MNESNQILYSEEVLEFVRLSKDYCTLLETDLELSQDEFIRFSLYSMTAIYSAMIRIPQLEAVFDEGSEKFVNEQDWSEIYRKIAACMEGNNDFLDVPAQDEFDRSELITRKVSEDMSDIYQDLRDFLEIYRNAPEDVMNDALWECQNNFLSFWGAKILRVSSALHKIYNGEVKINENIIGNDTQATEIDTRNWFISKRQQEYGDDGNDFFTEHQR